jgi:hypothetical protein
MMPPWMYGQMAGAPVPNLGMGGMNLPPGMLSQVGNANRGRMPGLNLPPNVLSKVGNANVGRIPELGQKPPIDMRKVMLGLGPEIMNNGFSLKMLPQIVQMLGRKGR